MEIRASAPTSSLIGRGERPTQLTTVTHPSTYRSVPGQCRAGFPGHRREAPRRPPPPSPPPQRSPAAATASSGLDSIRTYLTPCVGAAPFRRDFFPGSRTFSHFLPIYQTPSISTPIRVGAGRLQSRTQGTLLILRVPLRDTSGLHSPVAIFIDQRLRAGRDGID